MSNCTPQTAPKAAMLTRTLITSWLLIHTWQPIVTFAHILHFCVMPHAAMCDYRTQRGAPRVCLNECVCLCAQVPHLPAALKDMGADGGWPRPATCANRPGQDFFRYMRSALTAVGLITKQNHITGYTCYASRQPKECHRNVMSLVLCLAFVHTRLIP